MRAEPSAEAISSGTPPQPKSARWVQFAIPSVSDLVFTLLLFSLAAGSLAPRLLGDAGIGWHIRTGGLILASKVVPRIDPFSTMAGQPWYAWEWLYDVLASALHRIAGLNGVVFVSAFAIAGTFVLAFRRMLARGTGPIVAILLLLLTVFASSIHFFARPHIISWLLTVVWFEVLRDFESTGNLRRLFWLPPMMLLWVNVHGGFLVGLALIGLFFVAAVVGAVGPRDTASKTRTLGLLIVGASATVVTFVNPYGYHLHVHIYRYLTDSFLMDHIDEFLSPNFHGMAQKCFALLVLLTIAAAAMAREEIKTSELLVIAFAVYSGLYAARNIPVASLLLILIIAPWISESLRGWSARGEGLPGVTGGLLLWARFEERMGALESSLRGHWLPAAVVLLGAWACLQGGSFAGRKVMDAHFDPVRFPVSAVEWLSQQGVREPVFCPDNWGGYVIYQRYPEASVVVDDRHDFYGDAYLKQYLKVVKIEPGWDQALAGIGASWVLVPDRSAIATLLREVPAWRLVYHDGTAAVFQQNSRPDVH
jgi:hypothetical protein